MLMQLLLFILKAFFNAFVLVLLVRFYMQWLRISFRNPMGHFVVTVTDPLVRPARRIIPSLLGLDLASLLLAVGIHSIYLLISFWLMGYSFGAKNTFLPMDVSATQIALVAGAALLGVAIIEIFCFTAYLLIAAIAFVVLLSWINPHAPLAPLFNSIVRPFLRPFQRIIPPLAGLDLSPFFLMLILQIFVMFLDVLRAMLIPFIA